MQVKICIGAEHINRFIIHFQRVQNVSDA